MRALFLVLVLAVLSFGARAQQSQVPGSPVSYGAPLSAVSSGGVFNRPLLGPDGACSADNVTYSFALDTDTGMYRVGSNVLGFCSGANIAAEAVNGGFLVNQGAPGGQAGLGFVGANSGTGLTLVSSTRLGLYFSGSEAYDFSSTSLLNITGKYATSEIAAPSGASSQTVLYADSTAHALEASYNNDAFGIVQRGVSASLGSDTNNATTTLADALSVTLPVGDHYCSIDGAIQDSTGAEGVKLKTTGSLTATTSTGGVIAYSDAGVVSPVAAQSGYPATLTIATFATGQFHAWEFLHVTVSGTFKVQFAQNTHAAGTATMYKGTTIFCERM